MWICGLIQRVLGTAVSQASRIFQCKKYGWLARLFSGLLDIIQGARMALHIDT